MAAALMEKGRLCVGDHVALVYPPGEHTQMSCLHSCSQGLATVTFPTDSTLFQYRTRGVWLLGPHSRFGVHSEHLTWMPPEVVGPLCPCSCSF